MLNEDIYSSQVRAFIRLSKKTEKLKPAQRHRLLFGYLQDNFKKLGQGVFRQAFLSEKGEVVKIAVSTLKILKDQPTGPQQNKLEIEKFNNPYIRVFPKVEAFDAKDFLWFVVEKVTPLAKAPSGLILLRLFPKLFAQLKGLQHINQIKPNWYGLEMLIKYAAKTEEGFTFNDVIATYISRPAGSAEKWQQNVSNEGHKEKIEAIVNYLKKPDKNFSLLVRAIRELNVNPNDFHQNNIAFTDDMEIRIIDAGWILDYNADGHATTAPKTTPGRGESAMDPSDNGVWEEQKKNLNEDIYSSEMRNFIRFSKRTEKYDPIKRIKLLYDYLDGEMVHFGSGAFRSVFQTDSKELIKIARKSADERRVGESVEMNRKEIEKFNMKISKAFPKVEEVDKDLLWFVVEKVNVLTEEEDVLELFPQLASFLLKVSKKTNGHLMMLLLANMMSYVDTEDWNRPDEKRMPVMSFIRNIQADFMFSDVGEVDPDQLRTIYEYLFSYMKAGDLNWRILKDAIQKLNVKSFDLDFDNLGYDDEGIIKIIDAGF